MPSEEEFDELKGRIVELENQLRAKRGTRDAASITPEDLEAFTRVRDLLAGGDFGDFCGINDCFRCIITRCVGLCIVRCIQPCIYECTCGPCNLGQFGGGGAGRFGGLGG